MKNQYERMQGMTLVELLPQTSLASSKREAREFLKNGAVAVNGQRVSMEHALAKSDLLHGPIRSTRGAQ